MKSFQIDEEDKKIILITFYLLKERIDCALFGTTNLEHLNLIANKFEKYKLNSSELFAKLENLFE